MKFFQEQLQLKKTRGIHLITDFITGNVKGIREIEQGLCHVFCMHTSASLTINENADPTVRKDMEAWLNRFAPENDNYIHDYEGSDDMPAHIKSSLFGSSVTIPVKNGRLLLGTWQGIYFCEHRNDGGTRQLVITVWGV
jgi:secondary thiamine-phosphate synthase enzyme